MHLLRHLAVVLSFVVFRAASFVAELDSWLWIFDVFGKLSFVFDPTWIDFHSNVHLVSPKDVFEQFFDSVATIEYLGIRLVTVSVHEPKLHDWLSC